jgi:hypothetical protein
LKIHTILGTITLISNIILGLGIIMVMDWTAEKSIHGIVGTFLSSMCIVLWILGTVTRYAQNNLKWKTRKFLIIRDVH